MAKDVCSACDTLRASNSEFIHKGVTDEMCGHLKANQGLSNTGDNNCTDMHTANDCLIGGMLESMDSYDVCEVKDALKDLTSNVMNMFDIMICSDCGQWDEIDKLWAEIQALWAAIKALQDRVSALEGDNAKVKDALAKILQNLKNSGAWSQTGDTIYDGKFNDNRNIATGNINLFGGSTDGSYFIRTNSGSTENDLAGGL